MSYGTYKLNSKEVRAVQFIDSADGLCDLTELLGSITVSFADPEVTIMLDSPSGQMFAKEGDFIIEIAPDKFIACSPELFNFLIMD